MQIVSQKLCYVLLYPFQILLVVVQDDNIIHIADVIMQMQVVLAVLVKFVQIQISEHL